MKRKVRDVMTRQVITVPETTTYKDLVVLMRANDVSALPVLGTEGELIGIVSEADLLLKEEHDPKSKPHWLESGLSRA